MSPTTSPPGTCGSATCSAGSPRRTHRSKWFRAAARTRTSTSPGPATGPRHLRHLHHLGPAVASEQRRPHRGLAHARAIPARPAAGVFAAWPASDHLGQRRQQAVDGRVGQLAHVGDLHVVGGQHPLGLVDDEAARLHAVRTELATSTNGGTFIVRDRHRFASGVGERLKAQRGQHAPDAEIAPLVLFAARRAPRPPSTSSSTAVSSAKKADTAGVNGVCPSSCLARR